MKITESILINNFLKKLTFNHKNSLNLEDDIYYDPTRRMIFSTDTYEEGIHFFKYANPKNFIKKIFKASISDIYCKGFKPFSYFLSLSINKTNLSWFKNFKTEKLKLHLIRTVTGCFALVSIFIGIKYLPLAKPIQKKIGKIV